MFETGSGNVFADIGVPDPESALRKAELAAKIAERIKANRWSQSKAAQIMGIDQPKVSAIVRGRLKDFSLERLMDCLARMGLGVSFVYEPVTKITAHVIAKKKASTMPGTKKKRPTAVRMR